MPINTERFLKDDDLFKLVITLSIPAMVSGIVESLYNTIDAIFVGHFVGNSGLAALSVINVIQIMYIAFGVLFSVGSASIISRSLGAGYEDRAKQTMICGCVGVFLFVNMINVILLLNLEKFLILIGTTDAIMLYAKEYGQIIVWIGSILPTNMVLMGVLRAKGDVKSATYLNVLAAVLNVGLDALFIIVFDWGVAGAAVATAMAQVLLFFLLLFRVQSLYQLKGWSYSIKVIKWPLLREIVSVGFPTGLRLMLFVIVNSLVNIVLGPFGPEYLSAYGIFYRLVMVAAIVVICLTIGAQPIIGFNYGAQKYQRVKKIVYITLAIGIAVSLCTSVLLIWSPSFMYYIFTREEGVIKICQDIARIQGFTYCGWGIYTCVSEMLLAMGHIKASFLLSISYPISTILGFLILPKLFGLIGAYAVFPQAYLIIGIYAIIVFFRELKQLQQKIDNLKKAY